MRKSIQLISLAITVVLFFLLNGMMELVFNNFQGLTLEIQADPTVIFTGLYIVYIIIVIAVNVLVAVFIYRDAESRGLNGISWLIIISTTGFIGCLIYAIIRKEHPKSIVQ